MRKYGYYLFGRNLAIVVESKTVNGKFISPDESITAAADGRAGIKIKFLKSPGLKDASDNAITKATNETDTLDVDNQLALAVVDYVKSKFAESEKDYEKMQYHMNEFKRRVQRYQNKKMGGGRMMIPSSPYAIR